MKNKNIFINHYLDLYKKGETGLERLSFHLQSQLQSQLAKIQQKKDKGDQTSLCKTYYISSHESAYISFKETALIYEVAIEAEKKYYQTTLSGKIKEFVQNLLKRMYPSYETSLEEAEKFLKNSNEKLLEPEIKSETPAVLNVEAAYRAYTFMARHCSALGNTPIKYAILRETHKVSPNGDFYATPPFQQLQGPDYLCIQRPGSPVCYGSVYKVNLRELVGKGSEGAIYETFVYEAGENDKTEVKKVAIKISDSDIEDSKNSTAILKKIDSPYVIKIDNFFLMSIGSYQKETSFILEENKPAAYSLMDLYSGDLHDLLKEKLSDEQKQQLIVSLIKAVCAVHEQFVVHRDVKSKNVLVKKDNDAIHSVLTDFTFSVSKEDRARKSKCCGSPRFMAPEYAKRVLVREFPTLSNPETKEDITFEKVTLPCIDIWGLGLICYHIYTGSECSILPPSEATVTDVKFFQTIAFLEQSSIDNLFLEDARSSSDPYVKIILSMLQVNPEKRAEASKLKKECDELPKNEPNAVTQKLEELPIIFL